MHRFSFIFILPLIEAAFALSGGPNALASFNCEHTIDAPVPVLACKSVSDQNNVDDAWISLRKMPAWGTHAGLTIVDLCLAKTVDQDHIKLPSLIVSQNVIDEPTTGRNCLRRYCTDKKRAFSFFINSIPFPIGWTMIRFRFGREAQSFSISCDEFSQSI